MFGPSTGDPVFVCSLANDKAPGLERHVTTRRIDDISAFIAKYDRPGRGLYFAINTVKPNARRRAKETISEINCLHADIDFSGVAATPDEVRRILGQLMCLPSLINFTGHGLHCFWLLREAIAATPETIAEVEGLLRLLADHVGGDPQVAEISRLMRLPGTHNSKNGEWVEVTTEVDRPLRYDITDLRDWLEVAGPALHRRPKLNGAGEEQRRDPFLALAERQGFYVPVDVEARLRAMTYQGPGDSGIHATQLSVTASLLSHGEPIDHVVDMMLEATRAAAGRLGENWNWRHEERTLRDMCASWLAKHPQVIASDPETHTPPPETEAEIRDKVTRGGRGEAAETDEGPGGTGPARAAPIPAAAAPAASPAPATGRAKPIIRIVAGQLPRTVEQSEQALIDAGFQIFVRATLMYLITETLPAAEGRTTQVVKLQEIVPDLMLKWLAKAATFIKWDARSQGWVKTDPPRQLAATLLVSRDDWPFPPVAGVIASPTLRPDGSLLAVPGYDAATQLYLALDPSLQMPPLAAQPTRSEAELALRLLKDLLTEFKFASEADKAVALSLILTTVTRSAMPVAPLHLIRAHTPGTGKSYLVDLATAIASGRPCCPAITAAVNPDEAEKRLGALLREGVTIVALDNCSKDLEGDLLCQLTERPLVRMRILGQSSAPEFECKATVVATGNNIGPKGDMVRRTLTCNLIAEVERPELRSFKFDPIARVLADRGAYLGAVLTIVCAYQAAGSPDVCAPIGSYGTWSFTVRAPLIWLKEADPIESMETARGEDPDLINIRELFAFWQRHMPGEACSAFQLAETASEKDLVTKEFKQPEFHDLLLRIAGVRSIISSRKLGIWLRRFEGRIVEGLKLTVEAGGHAQKFRLQTTSFETANSPASSRKVHDETTLFSNSPDSSRVRPSKVTNEGETSIPPTETV
jgi:hypothetical protein